MTWHMRGHPLIAIALTSWTLLYSRFGTEWRPMDELPSPTACRQVQKAWMMHEATREIGLVLTAAPGEDSERRRAFERALRDVESRFRCVGR
jgi:hypothetical protein